MSENFFLSTTTSHPALTACLYNLLFGLKQIGLSTSFKNAISLSESPTPTDPASPSPFLSMALFKIFALSEINPSYKIFPVNLPSLSVSCSRP